MANDAKTAYILSKAIKALRDLDGLTPPQIFDSTTTEDSETTEASESSEDSEGTEGSENKESKEGTEDSEGTESSEDSEATERSEDTENSENTEDSENTENSEAIQDIYGPLIHTKPGDFKVLPDYNEYLDRLERLGHVLKSKITNP